MQQHEPVIVVIVRSRKDWEIVRTRHWYRLPVKHGPAEVTSPWIAFYLPRSFGADSHGIFCYAKVKTVSTVRRIDLLPGEPRHPRANERYFAISFEPPVRLARPLIPDKGRRFIWSVTTLWRLTAARAFEDLFQDEPLLPPEGEDMLVGVVPRARDFEIARLEQWYRVPVNMIRDWQTPCWVAFYFGRAFGGDSGTVQYYARVWHADVVRRTQMFPDQPRHPRAEHEYYRLHFEELKRRPQPVRSRRGRHLVVLPTTITRFMTASDVNDLVDGDEAEAGFYRRLTDEKLHAERAYHIRGTNAYHLTDYALFCNRANVRVDVESNSLPRRLLAPGPGSASEHVNGWESLRLSRYDITQRSPESIARVKEIVGQQGGVTSE